MTTANETLMGLEAKTRTGFERVMALRTTLPDPGFATYAQCRADGLKFIVTYHPERSWAYEFQAEEGGLRGKFDSRDSMLVALDWHTAVSA